MMRSQYIEDKPVEQPQDSAFQVHERIAEEIVKEITEPKDNGPRRIALVGEWGSGKSTVISFVEAGLKQRKSEQARATTPAKKPRLICFDLWGHKGEMLQRSFLQSLYDALNDDVEKALSAKSKQEPRGNKNACKQRRKAKEALASWLTLKRKIGMNRREETVETTSKISIVALISGLVAGFTAVAASILDMCKAILGDNNSAFPGYALQAIFWVSVAILLVSVVIIVARLFTTSYDGPQTRMQHMWRTLKVILAGRKLEHAEIVTESTVMGTIGFQARVEELLRIVGYALEPASIVIVLDNIDRLNGEQLQEAWNGIRVFDTAINQSLEAIRRGGKENRPAPDVWLILPISREAYLSIAGIGTSEISALASGTTPDTVPNPTSALTKLFAIRFDIPSPMVPEWKAFVVSCITKAFPELDENAEECQFAFSVFDCLPPGVKHRSSREAISLVNEMVSFYRVYGGVSYVSNERTLENGSESRAFIDLRSIAVFVFLKYVHETRLNNSVTFEEVMADYCANEHSRRGYGFPRYVLDYTDQLIPLMMMTFGTFDYQMAETAFLSTLLKDFEYVSRLDLSSMEPAIPGIWDAIINCVKGGVVFSNLALDSDCFFELAKKVADCRSPYPGRKALLAELISRMPEADWPIKNGAGAIVANLIIESGCSEESIASAINKIGDTTERANREAAYKEWRDNVIAFYDIMPTEACLANIPDVFLSSNAYDFVKQSFTKPGNSAAAQMVNIEGESAFASVAQGLVQDLRGDDMSEAEKQELIDFIADSPLYRSDGALETFADGQALGLMDAGDYAEYYYAAWNIYRRVGSVRARAFLQKGFIGPDVLAALAEHPYQKSAIMALCLDTSLGLTDRFAFVDNQLDLVLDEATAHETIERFAFSSEPSENRNYLDMVFDASGEEPCPGLRLRAARIILEEFNDRIGADELRGYRRSFMALERTNG